MERECRHYGSAIFGRPPHGHAVAVCGHSSTSASRPPFVSSPPPVGFSSYGWKEEYERAGLSFLFPRLMFTSPHRSGLCSGS